jgi:tRNA threonylcarbamoyladenosine biosynthesis protein TsaB
MDKLAPILAVETSQSCCAACVYFDGGKHFEISINLKNAHAEKIFEVIDSAIKIASIAMSDLKAIAVSSGPGSFTGLRIGMSAVKGLAHASGMPIIPVPTFEALALQISNYLPEDYEFFIANKVNTDEIYLAKFKVKTNNYIFARDLQIVKSNEFLIDDDESLIFGNASLGKIDSIKVKKISQPRAAYVAKWAIHFGREKLTNDFDFLEPNYFKNFIVKDKEI